ncbi:MAG: hypothetical protein JO263_05340 [Candidatus Eremiobacteraeota bacterium]|nr:hypothetical protein [Candidatus Eremiobacteraeota bacterium]
MRTFYFSGWTTSASIAALLLAGCAGQQPPFGAPSALPQSRAIAAARSAEHRNSSSSYQQLYRFRPPVNGVHPAAGLLDVNGVMYGTTSGGGLSDQGTVYRVSTSGVRRVLYRFRGGSDGSDPLSGLLDVNGTLYGTTARGGSSNAGTVYSVSTSGTENVLYAFKGGSDGVQPDASVIDVRGTLYGTTSQGGGTGCAHYGIVGCGTVFSLTTSGQETVLHRFAGGSDGAQPIAELIDVKGVLYGTTFAGDSCKYYRGCGTVYSITRSGAEKVLYGFQGYSDGAYPGSGLINVNGMLYGTTIGGGQIGSNCIYNACGTVYQISTTGAEQVVYRFKDGSDGASPWADLLEVNGVLYGTTAEGGDGRGYCYNGGGNCGTVYSVTLAGVEKVLYAFQGSSDGENPVSPLIDVNGSLYGTTLVGGDHDVCCTIYGYGTVFALTSQ